MVLIVRLSSLVASVAAAVGGWVVLNVSAAFLPVAGSVVAASITAFGIYSLGRRGTSGKIATSEAADLWEESQAMRRELREEVTRLRTRVLELEDRERVLERRIYELEGAR